MYSVTLYLHILNKNINVYETVSIFKTSFACKKLKTDGKCLLLFDKHGYFMNYVVKNVLRKHSTMIFSQFTQRNRFNTLMLMPKIRKYKVLEYIQSEIQILIHFFDYL